MTLLAAVLLVSVAAVSSTVPNALSPDYNPTIKQKIELDGGGYYYSLRNLPAVGRGCWYLRFEVKARNTVFVKFSVTKGDDATEFYEVMLGANGNKALCVQRSDGEWLLDIEAPNLLTGEWQYFYISQSKGRWSIGFQSDLSELASFYEEDVYQVKYVGLKSLKWSAWTIYRPGFGRNIIKTDIHSLGDYKWYFPEIPYGSFYFEFAVKGSRDCSIVFSPSNSYEDDFYELVLGAEANLFTCIRRKKGEKPIVDVVTVDVVDGDDYRYFWVRYDNKGLFRVGRYGERDAIAEFQDPNPLRIRYFGVTSYGAKSWWKFYILCPEPEYVCEHETFHLKCDYGLIAVDSALYGRLNKYYCNGPSAKDDKCGNPKKSLQRIQDKCYGQQECYIDAENDFFDDPCRGTFKYLQIDYHCCVCS